MALLQSALVEPLLSKQQTAVIREIARAAQLNEALLVLSKIQSDDGTGYGSSANPSFNQKKVLTKYLSAEITRVLMQIKIPATTANEPQASTNAPGKNQK